MTIETEQQLQQLRAVGKIVAAVLATMQSRTEPGMTTAELDQIGGELLAQYDAQSAPRITYDFPGHTCISVNEEAAHGIPGPRIIAPGDIVNIDVSAEKDGFFADTGGSFIVPPATPQKKRLLQATRVALAEACKAASADRPINGIGKAIQGVAKQRGFKVIKNLCSHGVGSSLHEYPQEIKPYYDRRDQRQLVEGMVITIEPFLSTRASLVHERADGWTLAARPGNLSAQFEHTMVITRGKPILLTAA